MTNLFQNKNKLPQILKEKEIQNYIVATVCQAVLFRFYKIKIGFLKWQRYFSVSHPFFCFRYFLQIHFRHKYRNWLSQDSRMYLYAKILFIKYLSIYFSIRNLSILFFSKKILSSFSKVTT